MSAGGHGQGHGDDDARLSPSKNKYRWNLPSMHSVPPDRSLCMGTKSMTNKYGIWMVKGWYSENTMAKGS
jgi:hypothetical protein